MLASWGSILTVLCARCLCLPFTINTGKDDMVLTFLVFPSAEGGHVTVLASKGNQNPAAGLIGDLLLLGEKAGVFPPRFLLL